jgi:hypothetical protein
MTMAKNTNPIKKATKNPRKTKKDCNSGQEEFAVHGVLIDPYRRQVSLIEVTDNCDDFRKMLQCEKLAVTRIASGQSFRSRKDPEARIAGCDIWYDYEFKPQTHAGFRITPPEEIDRRPIHVYGYGFICCSKNDVHHRTCLHVKPDNIGAFMNWLSMGFEQWERRTPKVEFIEERMRNIELEMPERFAYLYTLEAELNL